MSHSRDASASSDVSDEGSRQYCKAITHNIAKTDEDLMFIKGDLIQVVDKISDSCWLVSERQKSVPLVFSPCVHS